MTSKYKVEMEIAGPLAMWSRPDTGSAPTSYPVPTWSAAKGIFEAIAFFADGAAWIRPTRVEVCKPAGSVDWPELGYQPYTTNYGGPLRESKHIKQGNNYQLSSLTIANPCYRLYGVVENGRDTPLRRGDNPCHRLQAIFQRRLKKGQAHRTPCLGLSEFTASYWGPIRNQDNEVTERRTEVDKRVNLALQAFMQSVFDSPVNGAYAPRFTYGEDCYIREGVLDYVA